MRPCGSSSKGRMRFLIMDRNDNDLEDRKNELDSLNDVKESSTGTDDKTNGGLWSGVKWFFSSWKRILGFLLLIAAVVGVMFLFQDVIKPKMVASRTDRQSNVKIVSYDHSWDKTRLDSKVVDGLNVNTNQYVLHYKDNSMRDGLSSSQCFVFKGEGVDPKHTVKVVLSPGDSKSANFVTSQWSTLHSSMQSGKTSVQVCVLLNQDEYSAVAIEALGEIDYNDKTKTWEAIQSLVAVDPSDFKTYDEKTASVLRTVTDLGVGVSDKSRISTSSLKNGSFMQWSRMMTNDNKVEKIPALWVDGGNLSSVDTFRMYDPNALSDKLNNLK